MIENSFNFSKIVVVEADEKHIEILHQLLTL